MAQRNGSGTMLCAHNPTVKASEAKVCFVVIRPEIEQRREHSFFLDIPTAISDAVPDSGTRTAVAT